MRVIAVLLALVAMPFMASAAQGQSANRGRGHDEGHCAMRARLHPGKEVTPGNDKCAVPAPVPPPAASCTVTPPSSAGNLSIEGSVFLDVDPWPGLAGWCVTLTGPVSATAMTDASGNYIFTGLPEGTYTVCEVVPSGWNQTFPTFGPACATGLGWSFDLAGYSAGFVSFYNNQMP